MATLKPQAGHAPTAQSLTLAHGRLPAPTVTAIPPKPEPATIDGTTYRVYYGDLHRHTDLSLCFPFFDGSIDDAYRYATEVARLDFLGITDHTRDIDLGDALSQLWWRSTKEVTRHRLRDAFYPFFSYERSHGTTDHNVISLRDDMLRPHPPDLPKFWAQIQDRDTFTIPHGPVNLKAWKVHDNQKRPLMEVYQGFRHDLDSLPKAHAGLDKGYRFGFIASSDHLTTSSSFASVWSPAGGREPIFRAMQKRRTFGATDKLRLIFRSGGAWMGQAVRASAGATPFDYQIDGTAPLRSVDVIVDGQPHKSISLKGRKARGSFELTDLDAGEHYVYIRVHQTDGHRAWSSPIWVNVQ